MKIHRNLVKRTIAIVGAMIMTLSTAISAKDARLINSKGVINLNTNEGSVSIDTDDIEDNAQALAGLDSQLGGLSFKHEDGYYWAKVGEDGSWEKIGAVGSAEPWMVLKSAGAKNITFSSESGVDIAGTMENYAGNKNLLVTSHAKVSNIGGKKYLSLEVPFTGYYTALDNALDADTTRINYALAELGDAEAENVLDGKYFTSSAGIRTKGSIKNNGVLNWNPSGIATIAINGFYSGGTVSTANAYNAGYEAGKRAGIAEGRGQNTGFGRGSYTLDTLAWIGRACDCYSNSYMISPPMGYDGTVSLDYIASGGWRDHQTGGVTGTLTVHNMTRGTSVSYSGSKEGRMNITGRTLSFYKNDVIKITLDANSPSWHAWCQGGVTFY